MGAAAAKETRRNTTTSELNNARNVMPVGVPRNQERSYLQKNGKKTIKKEVFVGVQT